MKTSRKSSKKEIKGFKFGVKLNQRDRKRGGGLKNIFQPLIIYPATMSSSLVY